MKLYQKDGKYIEVRFWSFVKCHVLAQLAIAGIIYGIVFLGLIIVGVI